MVVVVNIWPAKRPKRSVWNAVERSNVGHASLSIVDEDTGETLCYVSHRPRNVDDLRTEKDFLIHGMSEKAGITTFEKDCNDENRKDISPRQINIYGLNETRMLSYYDSYEAQGQYHILYKSCCSVVVDFIREGLDCGLSSEERCSKCKSRLYQSDVRLYQFTEFLFTFLMYFFATILLVTLSAFSLGTLIILRVIMKPLFVPLPSMFGFNIEAFVSRMDGTFWSPVTLERFASRVRTIKDEKPDYECPYASKGRNIFQKAWLWMKQSLF